MQNFFYNDFALVPKTPIIIPLTTPITTSPFISPDSTTISYNVNDNRLHLNTTFSDLIFLSAGLTIPPTTLTKTYSKISVVVESDPVEPIEKIINTLLENKKNTEQFIHTQQLKNVKSISRYELKMNDAILLSITMLDAFINDIKRSTKPDILESTLAKIMDITRIEEDTGTLKYLSFHNKIILMQMIDFEKNKNAK
jgi:hypothetical protein